MNSSRSFVNMELDTVNKVMLIDDDPSCVFILSEFINLVDSNIEKISVHSVDDALEVLKSTNDFPEVIFLDLNMPIRTGFDFLEEYRADFEAHHPTTRIIVLTSSLRPSDREKTLSYNCVTDFKSKSEIDQFIHDSLKRVESSY